MSRILVDTNILISALVFPGGLASRAFWRVVLDEQLFLTEWVLAEAHEVVRRKWPHRLDDLDALPANLPYELLPSATSGTVIRDAKDQPILDAAIASAVDIILTGDKDFLALAPALATPRILNPRGYLDLRG